MHKVNELAILTCSDVYLVVERQRQYSMYKSKADPAWPPPEEEIVSDPVYNITQD